MGFILLPVHAQEHAGSIEEAALRIEPRRAYRVVERGDLVAQAQRHCAIAIQFPGVLVELPGGHLAPTLVRLQMLQILRKFAHQITSRDPHRQAYALQRGGPVYRDADRIPMRMQIQQRDGEEDRRLPGTCRGGRGGHLTWRR